MVATFPKIASFPKDDRIWRIEWIRSIEHNPSVPSEPLIQLVIAPFTKEAQNKYEQKDQKTNLNSRKITGEQEVITIGVGQLPLVKIGSLWQKGRYIKLNVDKNIVT